MSKDRAWLRAGEARELAYALKQASAPQSFLEKPDPNIGLYAILELLAEAFQALTIDDQPLRLTQLKIGGVSRWWN